MCLSIQFFLRLNCPTTNKNCRYINHTIFIEPPLSHRPCPLYFFQPLLLCLFLGRELFEQPIEVLLGIDCQRFVLTCLKADLAIVFICLES